MTDLILSLKREYFEQIKVGAKTEEYRLCNAYWRKRLTRDSPYSDSLTYGAITIERAFDRIVLTLGYSRRDDDGRRIVRPYRGYIIKTITHPHFGPDPVWVYAIDVRPE